MKNLSLLYILAVIMLSVFTSCDNDSNNDCNPETESGTIHTGFEIIASLDSDTLHPYDTILGNNNVFEYQYNAVECDDVHDDEFGYFVRFEVPDLNSEFSYTDEELITARAYYNEFGAWSNVQLQILSGTIKGTRINDTTYEVDASITTEPLRGGTDSKTIDFETTFSIE